MDNPGNEPYIRFVSELYLPSYVNGDRHLEHYHLTRENGSLSYTDICIFLNCHELIPRDYRPYLHEDNKQSFYFYATQNPQHKIIIEIAEKIFLKISREFLLDKCTLHETYLSSYLGEGFKRLKYMHHRRHIFYDLILTNLSESSKCLLYHTDLILQAKEDFSKSFQFFAKYISISDNEEDVKSIKEYKDCYVKKQEFTINSIETLSSRIGSHLFLNIQQSNTKKRLEKVLYNGERYYIVSGVYFSNEASSILTENNDLLSGFLLDTTWKIMARYVTSILMGSCFNTGLGLGFSFGRAEDRDNYGNLLKAISQITGFDFHNKVFESDQGSALKAICDEYNITHLKCLRHLLVSLKYNEFSYQIGILLRGL